MTIPGADAIEPAPGPRWTHKRLVNMLKECYGVGPRGGINVPGVAAYTGVSPSTVYRWISPGQTQYRLAIPPGRLSELQLPPPMDEVRALQSYRHALRAIDSIAEGEAWSEWEAQGWLLPHYVVINKLMSKPWMQIMATRVFPSRPRRTSENLQKPEPGAGDINRLRAWDILHANDIALSAVAVPHYFYAQVLVRAVMIHQWWWRVYPMRNVLPVGRTRLWMSDAPAVKLRALAHKAGVPVLSNEASN